MDRRRRRHVIERDLLTHTPIANDTLLDDFMLPPEPVLPPVIEDTFDVDSLFDLREVSDRRSFHPMEEFRPAPLLDGRPAVVDYAVQESVAPLRKGAQTGTRMQFRRPEFVAVCVRRAVRREVMHAKGFAGGRVRRRRRNYYSDVRC